jgi:hypothetical protein
MLAIKQTIIRFPEISLAIRDAHKIRGYFGRLFQEHSPLLHNHGQSGENLRVYPLVQYKVLDGIPTLIALNDGADLLTGLFLSMRTLQLEGRSYPILQKNMESKTIPIGLSDDLHSYRFETLWMALNQDHFAAFVREDEGQRLKHLKAVLIANILSFFSAVDYRAQTTVMLKLTVTACKEAQFKNKSMMVFAAEFTTNAVLPDKIGLGRQSARGFGTITSI